MSILEQITEFPERFLKRFRSGDNSVVGIDIGASSVKVVQLRRKKGQAILETYGELALGPYADLEVGQSVQLSVEKIAEAVKDVLREANVTTKQSAFSIPLSSSLTSVIEFPAVSEDELKSMVPIEARKYIPVPISEVTLDWWIIPHRERGIVGLEPEANKKEDAVRADAKGRKKDTKNVLLVAIHNNTIEKYRQIAKLNNLNVGFLEIETFSAIRSLLARGTSTFLILDMGSSTTNVSVVESGVVYRSHVVNRGSQDITVALSKSLSISILKAEEMKRMHGLVGKEGEGSKVNETARLIMEGVLTKVNRVLLDYEKKENEAVSQIILSGGGALLKGVTELAAQNLDTEVVYGNPFEKVETPAFLEDVLKNIGPSFSVALGVALRRLQEIE
ncbi:hypothetical protein CL630_00770 [bacterium]|nr:hypothetical protein [bacterium]|tara:strand:+ start:46063 stop:47235 length:1173 start_codon:yes stop_codon:yes gene_type:complete